MPKAVEGWRKVVSFLKEKILVMDDERRGFMKMTPRKSVRPPREPMRHQLVREGHGVAVESMRAGVWSDVSLEGEVGMSEIGRKR